MSLQNLDNFVGSKSKCFLIISAEFNRLNNNNVESWHNKLNHSARHAQLNLYHLISLLHDEARLVNIQVKLVSEGRIRQDHRHRYANLQGRIFRYWGKFAARERDATSLLRACSRVNGPQM